MHATPSTTSFMPLNDLERFLLSASEGELAVPALLDHMLQSSVVVLLNREITTEQWPEDASMLVLQNPVGEPVLAVFTSLERVAPWLAGESSHQYAMHADFAWLLRNLTPEMGVAVNPGSTVGFEIPPFGVEHLRGENTPLN